MGDMLSQDEINALLGGIPNEADDENLENSILNTDSDSASDEELNSILSDEDKDVLGEIGNISMGTSATTLFALLGEKVSITIPRVIVLTWRTLANSYDRPCVGIKVNYKEGIQGSNILILKQRDVKIIANLMMGGDGKVEDEVELNEIDLSAIGEAMNQMVGSASTSLSSMVKKKVDIDTPQAFQLSFNDDNFFQATGFDPNEILVCTAFKMEIGNLIDSEIMQVLPKEFALSMVSTLKNSLSAPQQKASLASAQPAPAPAPQPQPEYQQQQVSTQNQQQAPPPQYQQPAPPPQYQQPMYQQPMYQQPVYQQPVYQQPNVNVQPVQFQNFDPAAVMQQKENIDIIMDVPLEVSVELGRTHKKIKEILEFTPGTIIELDKLAGEPIDILINGKFVAKGEVVVIDENFGIRITDIINVEERI